MLLKGNHFAPLSLNQAIQHAYDKLNYLGGAKFINSKMCE